MAVDWTEQERTAIENGIAEHGIDTGRCAALARIVYRIAKPRDPDARALHVRPAAGARWLVPKEPRVPYWGSHTYVETEEHAVDAVAGADGHHPADRYLQDYWEFSATLRVSEVDPATIDPGIQDADGEP
jgi:hypothetical protein